MSRHVCRRVYLLNKVGLLLYFTSPILIGERIESGYSYSILKSDNSRNFNFIFNLFQYFSVIKKLDR